MPTSTAAADHPALEGGLPQRRAAAFGADQRKYNEVSTEFWNAVHETLAGERRRPPTTSKKLEAELKAQGRRLVGRRCGVGENCPRTS